MKLFAAVFGARWLTPEQRAQREREAREAELAREREVRDRALAEAVEAQRAVEAEAWRVERDRRQRIAEDFAARVTAARVLFPHEYYGPADRDYFRGLRQRHPFAARVLDALWGGG